MHLEEQRGGILVCEKVCQLLVYSPVMNQLSLVDETAGEGPYVN